MDTQSISKRIEEIVMPVLENLGYSLVERELIQESGLWILRLYIDKEGGVTISDCANVSRGLGDLLEVEEVIPFKYNLEISSPGIDRPIRWREDFEKFKGNNIKLKTLRQLDGRGNFKGTLQGMEGDNIVILIDGTIYKVPYEELAKAKLVNKI